MDNNFVSSYAHRAHTQALPQFWACQEFMNHGIIKVGRDFWRSSLTKSHLKQGQLPSPIQLWRWMKLIKASCCQALSVSKDGQGLGLLLYSPPLGWRRLQQGLLQSPLSKAKQRQLPISFLGHPVLTGLLIRTIPHVLAHYAAVPSPSLHLKFFATCLQQEGLHSGVCLPLLSFSLRLCVHKPLHAICCKHEV